MAETTMPTAEAEVMADADNERVSYELAFHVLPTVVEGEVPAIFDAVKKAVTDAGGEIFDEEAPQRFDLAYEIVKHVEGRNRKFSSAYFGWIRFKAETSAADPVAEAVEHRPDILRLLLIRLTREEEANPFRFHEALASEKKVTDVEETEVTNEGAEQTTTKEDAEVNDDELEEALKKDEA